MAVEEQRFRIRRSIEEKLGVEEAAYLIEGRPPGGWDALVTKEYLDLRLEAFEGRIQRHINRILMWLVPTIFAGMAAAGWFAGRG